MPFDYDEANPDDDGLIPAFPASERAFRTTVKMAIDVEHDAASGRHTFGFGSSAARDAITDWADGAVWFLAVGITYKMQVRVVAFGGWLDVLPPDTYAARNALGNWLAPQYAATAVVTPGAGSPNTIAVVMSISPHRKVTLTANSQFSAPGVGLPANTSTTIVYEVFQDATGGRTLSFAGGYVFAGGVVPQIATAANARSVVVLVKLDSGEWFASVTPDVKVP